MPVESSNAEKILARLSTEEREEVIRAMREAAFHLASCWDELRDIEHILEGHSEDGEVFTIETDDIEGMVGDLDIPPNNAYKIQGATIFDVLRNIEVD